MSLSRKTSGGNSKGAGFPAIAFAARIPQWRAATQVPHIFPWYWTGSPAAKIPGTEVRQSPSIVIPLSIETPRGPRSSLRGATPAETTKTSPSTLPIPSISRFPRSPEREKAFAFAPRMNFIPFFSRASLRIAAPRTSSCLGIRRGKYSTISTLNPSFARWYAISRPRIPPPMHTAVFLPAEKAVIAWASSADRRQKTPGCTFNPGTGGTVAWAPTARRSIPYRTFSPEARTSSRALESPPETRVDRRRSIPFSPCFAASLMMIFSREMLFETTSGSRVR